LFQGL